MELKLSEAFKIMDGMAFVLVHQYGWTDPEAIEEKVRELFQEWCNAEDITQVLDDIGEVK
jgi:uncharacterized protein YutE (UPF0331/DUF86 family)